MLRSLEGLQFVKSRAGSLEIQMSPQGKMVEVSLDFQTLQFENRIQHGKDMIVCVVTRRTGALPKAAFCLSDLWKTSTGHRF
jgi:hypothetical protein